LGNEVIAIFRKKTEKPTFVHLNPVQNLFGVLTEFQFTSFGFIETYIIFLRYFFYFW